MSRIWAIIPVKPLANAKSRLAPALTPTERQQLAEHMFRHVLKIATSVPQLAGTLVISRDNKALAIAREYGAKTVQESGAPEMNAALMRATSLIARWRGSGVLILPADLPLIAVDDVVSMVELGDDLYSMVIATDQDRDGTNAMLVRPPGLMEYGYGPGSFDRHIERAKAAGAHVQIYESERLQLDIDLPEDLDVYTQWTNGASGNGAVRVRDEIL
ncbi:MAG: 2-phospho-L-lactate guanylyltransferase [Anaerolineae bacterium]|nr:2-phospho-L-lactate guanylyltransferase [Anaerolineae bacterium]